MELKIIYGITALVSLLLVLGYYNIIKGKDKWFVFLYVSVFVVNCGYWLMSLTKTLEGALLANRVSYFGSVFLPLCMFVIIMNVCKVRYNKWTLRGLGAISIIVFVIAASGGYTDWYYKEVTLTFVGSAAKLVKEYGPLHNVYYFYLFSYFAVMTGMILYARFKKKVFDRYHAILILCATLGNIAVWLIEQLIRLDFEFLSVSYIVTEVFLLLIYAMFEEQKTLEEVKQEVMFDIDNFVDNHPQLQVLTVREKEVVKLIVQDKKRKEIADALSVTEHTIKKHTAHIFAKIEVSNRAELFEKLGMEVRMVEK